MVNRIVNELKNILEETPYFYCDCCFLRGSFITKEYKKNSDIDLLIISRDFKYMSYLKRQELIQNTVKELDASITVDALCLSREEYMQLIREKRQMLKDERMVRII